MRGWFLVGAILIVGCEGEEPSEADWPSAWTEEGDPVVDAWQVWRLGADYLPEDTKVLGRDIFEVSFPDEWSGKIDTRCRDFLRSPALKPAVQFGCTSRMTPFEDSLESALDKGDFHVRLQAVAILMKVRAPRSVPEQFRTLQDLAPRAGGAARRLIDELMSEFQVEKLLPTISRPPDDDLCWFTRAAGAARLDAALPRLRALSRVDTLHVSLSAERSLEDFHGPEADEALVHCLLGWQYNAAEKAGRALLARDRNRLRQALLSAPAPEGYRYKQGLLLAQCDASEAVPILCETVFQIGIVDKDMFRHIGRLATPEHETHVLSLPGMVREEQRGKASAAVEEYRRRTESAEGN